MTKVDDKVEELLAKHPSLTKLEALEIITAKNDRKKKKRTEKADKINAKRIENEAKRPDNTEG